MKKKVKNLLLYGTLLFTIMPLAGCQQFGEAYLKFVLNPFPCTKDVSSKTRSWGGYEKDAVYALLFDVYLLKFDSRPNSSYAFSIPSILRDCTRCAALYSVPPFEEYNENKKYRQQGFLYYPEITGIVKAGTMIKCIRTEKSGNLYGNIVTVYANILDGPFEGIEVKMSDVSCYMKSDGFSTYSPEYHLFLKIE